MSDTATTPTTTASPLGGIASQARALWTKLPARARMGAIASAVALVALLGYVMMSGSGGAWKQVTEGLTAQDAVELISKLDERGIQHRLRKPTVVEVPASKVDQARAIAVIANLPRKRVDVPNPKFLTSVGEKAQWQRALQDELSYGIEKLGPIEQAEVRLAFAKDSVFKDSGAPATASVRVTLRGGVVLNGAQVGAIKQFIANAFTALTPDHVSVMDQDANPLTTDDTGAGAHASDEDAIAAKLRDMLEPVVGVGKAKVAVRVDRDRRSSTKTEIHFDEPKVLSRHTVGAADAPALTAPAQVMANGIAGTQGNLPGTATGPAGGGGAATGTAATSSGAKDETVNNQLGSTTTQTEDPADRVARISVTVLVDTAVDEDGEPLARTDDEMKKLTEIAHTAAGLDDERGDKLTVQSMPFLPIEVAVIPPMTKSKLPVPMPVALGLGGALVIGVVLVATRRKRKPADDNAAVVRVALPAPLAELERALATPSLGLGAGEPAALPALAPGRTLEERVIGVVKGDVPRASRVLASWLAEPDPPSTNLTGNNSHKGARA